MWGMDVDRTGGEADELWKKGLEVAEGMVDFTQEERLENLFPSEEEEEEEEEGSENDESDDEKTEQNTNSSPKKRKTEQKTNSPPKKRIKIAVAEDSESESEEETFEVEKILDMKKEGGITKYLVKWQGFDKEEDNTWEPLDNLDCEDKIKLFEDKAEAKCKILTDEKPEPKFSAAAC